MIPAQTGGREVLAISRDGAPVEYENETIKGILYAMFPVETGAYSITYAQRQITGSVR
jgi:hypothetical protein